MAEKYPWITSGYFGVGTTEDVKQYSETRLAQLNDQAIPEIDLSEKRKALAKQLKLTETEVSALDLARKLIEFMDERKEWMMRTRILIDKPLCEIKNGWFYDDGSVRLLGKEATRELWERYVDFKSATSSVIGLVASNGGHHFVSGTVFVASSPTDPVPDKAILVAPMTSPSYVPLMRKASALVTDHGGVMSHAAIVAREFNLPCIVGTKTATKTLKTGDKVILDMLRGEIIG
jgi:phosphoenolpyruvate synthase/pyruvate phosphate dikinase